MVSCLSTLSMQRSLVFVALTQHHIQSTIRCENYSTLYKVTSCPCQKGRLYCRDILHVLLKTERIHVNTVDMCVLPCQHVFMSTLLIQRKDTRFHLVFKMFYSKQREFMLTLAIHAACNKIRSHPNSFHCICQHCQYIHLNYNVDSVA